MRSFSVTNEMGVLKFLRMVVCLGPLFELGYLVRGGLFGCAELIPILLGLHLMLLGLQSCPLLVDVGLLGWWCRLRRRGLLPGLFSLSRGRLLCLGSLQILQELRSLPVLQVAKLLHSALHPGAILECVALPDR